jgi:pseudouridylate synthase
MPAFYTRESEFGLSLRVESPEEVADTMRAKWDLGLKGGAVVANPIPVEDAMESSFINGIIEKALKEAEENGIKGKDVTPFLLGKVKELTEGKSLEANIALVKHNAVIGSQIAVALQKNK